MDGRDGIVPVEQSINFAAQIEKIAGPDCVTLEILEKADHGDPLFETPEISTEFLTSLICI